MRAESGPAPQSHSRADTRARCRAANSRASTATAIVAATTAAATSSGARDPANPCSRTVNKPADTGSAAPNTRPLARADRGEHQRRRQRQHDASHTRHAHPGQHGR